MEQFNIEYFKNYENVTLAEYEAAKKQVEDLFASSIKQGKLKEALKYAAIYMKLDKLTMKRSNYHNKYGNDGKRKR